MTIMEQSLFDSEMYFFREDATAAAATTTQVDFFIDPSLNVTEAVNVWLEKQKATFSFGNTMLNYSIPMVITGSIKVRIVFRLPSLFHVSPDSAATLLQGGKTTVLSRFIPGLLRNHPDFGLGAAAEARFLRLGGANRFDRNYGVSGFLRSLLEVLLRETSRLGNRTSARLPPVECQYTEPLGQIDLLLSELPNSHQYFILLDEASVLNFTIEVMLFAISSQKCFASFSATFIYTM